MNLILLESGEAEDPARVEISGARAEHLRTVLRVSPGDTVRIGLVDGPCGVGTVISIGSASVSLRCSFEAQVPARAPIDLLLALPRPKVLRRLWAQLAALGVGRVMLTNAARVERNYFDTHLLQPEVFRPLLLEGLQQARDTRVPLVSVHRQLKIFVEDELGPASDTVRAYGEPGSSQSLGDAVRARAGRSILLAVGPEGGWNEYECDLLSRHGFTAITMGPRTLRSDTACVALLALAHDALMASGTSSSR